MAIPVSWLKDYVDIDITVEELARRLTLAGLEVEEIRYVGWPLPHKAEQDLHAGWRHEFRVTGIAWDREKIVVAEIREVMPHPNADRLVLCTVFDGLQEYTVLTGAPNLFDYKGRGALSQPLKAAYAKEGARIYDGHAEGQAEMVLKRAKIRGVESFSMICSEKELGISDDHEGVILLDADAPVGMPLADYMGDAVLEINILPNMARNASILGIAREVAALTGKPLKKPGYRLKTAGESIRGRVAIKIESPELNPRFMLGLIRNVKIGPSPYWVQRRLRLAGMRPINNIVDATNYAMLELGEPLHAFDYDVLVRRSKGKPVTITTRPAKPGEKLTTLDGEQRKLDPNNVLVCDAAGALSIAGVMGGAESEVTDGTHNVLLEAAAWNFINIRRTAYAHNLHSEASFRFSRGVHPALAEQGLNNGLYWMSKWSGGQVAPEMVDNYPLPPKDPTVSVTTQDVSRLLGVRLTAGEIADLLTRLEFTCKVDGESVLAQVPAFRMDIGEGVIGVADVVEEIARLYGYDRIPETRLRDELPAQYGNPDLMQEERLRDLLARLGLYEAINTHMTAPEREALLYASGKSPTVDYVRIANPIAPDRTVLRSMLLAGLLEVVKRNARLRDSLAFFEIGPVFIRQGNDLPLEPRRLAIALSGRRHPKNWEAKAEQDYGFFDLKGLLEALFTDLHLVVQYSLAEQTAFFHPGKCAQVMLDGKVLGLMGQLHPLVQANYDIASPVLATELDLEAILEALPGTYDTRAVPEFPPVFEDIAIILDESTPAAQVEALIRQTGGRMLAEVRLFDIYRGEQIGAGRKSLAYNLTYQAPERTLTDQEVAKIRQQIIRRLEKELGARLRT